MRKLTILGLSAILSSSAYAGERIQVASVMIPTQQQASVQTLLAVKASMKRADGYLSSDMPGNALIKLLEAQNMANGSFEDELGSRIKTAVVKLKNEKESYKIKVRVNDNIGNGRADYIKLGLDNKQYVSGIELNSSSAQYTLTLDLRTLDVEEKRTTGSHVIMIPTGTTKNLNGAYTALETRVRVECADYFAERDAARGAGVKTAVSVWNLVNALDAENVYGAVSSGISMADGISRTEVRNTRHGSCQEAMDDLESTPRYTSDTQTQPFQYEEETTRKTARLGMQISLTYGGTALFTSSPLDIEFMKEDVYKPNIPVAHISGDPLEEIPDSEVIRGVLQAVPTEIYEQINQGGDLWDVIALSQAQRLAGESALEANVQLYFDGHNSVTRNLAMDYITEHTGVSRGQLEGLEKRSLAMR